MKSNKGIAMVSLVIYVASFLVITTLVGTISTYFYNNINLVNSTVGGNAEYTKLNLYLINLTKDSTLYDIKVLDHDPLAADPTLHDTDVHDSIVFRYDDNGIKKDVLLTRQGKYLYYDKVLLCSDVSNFNAQISDENGKHVLLIVVKLSGSSFSTRYVFDI